MDKLFLVHRLDKHTTGCLMLSKSAKMCAVIQELYKRGKVTKRYWCITKGVPDPPEGLIKIPLAERKLGGRFVTSIVPVKSTPDGPDMPTPNIRNRVGRDAATEYRIISKARDCALVECGAMSGFKHQIRVHLGFGIGTPILGDHKYSNYLALKPQRLSATLLQRLGIRSAKSRHLPLYLHARDIVIPEFSGSRNLFVRAPLHEFFKYTLKLLKIAKTAGRW